MSTDKPRRSRTAWPGPLSTAGVPPQHTHELPRALRRSYRLLLVAVVALLLAVGTLTYFVYQQQQYVEGRGEYRDAEAARMEQESTERIRRAMCDLLDQLPEGGLLNRPRTKYHCGPGIPLSQLTPQEQAQLSGRTAVPAPAPTLAPLPPAASPSASRPAPGTLPPRTGPGPGGPTPMPTPPSPSLLDPGAVTGPACDALGICI